MPDSTAKTRLKAMTAWDKEPLLTDGEIDDLLLQFRTTDANGVKPGGTGYVNTYNLRAAAYQGWQIKMGRATDLISSDLDGDRLSANQVFEHCERMARKYAPSGSPSIPSSTLMHAAANE